MIAHPQDRRAFLRAAVAAGAVWAGVDLAHVDEALARAVERRNRPAGDAEVLTPAQAEDVEAITARIIPSEPGSPGAREAGAVHFIDRSLATFNAGQKKLYTDGLADLNRRAGAKGGASSFAALSPQQQDDVLREIDNTPFFQNLRFATIVGTFALPSYGGNTDYVGWTMIGLDHQPLYRPPFGYYDAEANGGR